APVSVAAQDRGLKYIWAYNQRTARPEEIVGHFDWDIFTPEEAAHVTAIKHRVLKENIELREQMWFNRPGERIFLDVCWEPIHDQSGRVIGVASATVDLTPIKLAEEALKASLAEKEVLLKEIHHRVKNNMQVISSLVDLQADEVKDSAMRAIFQDVIYRVRSMAMVHEKLYQSSDLAQVDFADYAQSLLVYLWRAQSPVASAIQLDLDLKPVSLSVNAAVPCGLILNELFSNALKHAFPGRGSGKVMVALDEDGGGKIRLRVCDDGVGLPSGLDWEKSHSLGLRIIRTLARQLNAKVEVSNVQGTQFTILFKR
ncbi:sensor histidine kinase, partial [Desulfosarcina sp.]|uniref:sensor histidine kinase n=1 Tax=Desulfosarcina sp. TaxID=2027861 RepID=UPI003970E79B